MLVINHTAHLVTSSAALAFLTNISDKHKSASPCAIQVKNQQKTISTGEKLVVLSRCERGERFVDICHNVRLAHSSIRTICDNVDN
jgi:hypothetical protein